MSSATDEDVRQGLARFLSERWDRRVTVGALAPSTAGARRRNILFDADDGTTQLRLCVTITSDPGLLVIANQEQRRNAVDVEASIREVARAAGVPVPQLRAVCMDPDVLGGPFMVADCVEGETIPRRVLRLVENDDLGARVAAQLGEALARLHGIRATDAPHGLSSRATTNPAEAALDIADRELTALLAPRPALALALRWLEVQLPTAPERRAIVHGDARNGNLVVGSDGLRALLDWERTTRDDDPARDIAWPAVRMWRFGNDDREIGGFAPRGPFLDAYVGCGGTYDEDRIHWWKVMSNVSWALGLAGQAAQHLDGTTPSLVLAASGRRIHELEWDTLMLIAERG